MILHQKIVEQLQAKWSKFTDFDLSFRDEAKGYASALDRLSEDSAESLVLKLSGFETPGALPTPEFDLAPGLCLNFAAKFENHKEARQWAFDRLLGHTTFAVDGSQIKHSQDYSIPVAAVQVAWFENHHRRDGKYNKDLKFEILTPDDLIDDSEDNRGFSEQRVHTRRFELEVETLCELMQKYSSQRNPADPIPVALFDSSIVISFADRLADDLRARHVKAATKLLRCSRDTGIPVIGYVDTTYARDLTNMLAHCYGLAEATRVHDAQLINKSLSWGCRTPIFVCARGGADRKHSGVLEDFGEFKREVGFVYLKTTASSPPARLEIPLWVYQSGLLEEIIDIVRAEIIVGNGYPYVIETADATAVISNRDREAFYAIFQRFAVEQGTELRISRKATSKIRRR